MPEQDTDLLKVLVGQVAEHRDINTVLYKALGILGHAELFEPVCNLLHRLRLATYTLSVLDRQDTKSITNALIYCTIRRRAAPLRCRSAA
jgi:hypothetical protein